MVIEVSDAERILANVNASMTMEGMELTESDKKRITDCLMGTRTYEDTIKELVRAYKKAI